MRTNAPESSVVVRVSGGNVVDEDGLLTGPEGSWLDEPAKQALEDLQVWSVPNASILRQRPGRYYWQAYVSGEGDDRPIGPVRQLNGDAAGRRSWTRQPVPEVRQEGLGEFPRLDGEPAVIGLQDALQDAREDHAPSAGG